MSQQERFVEREYLSTARLSVRQRKYELCCDEYARYFC
jgi:hypothetical protein